MTGWSTIMLSFVLISLTLFSAPVTSAPHLSKRTTASLKCWGCTPEQLAALKIAQSHALEALSGLEKVLGYDNVEKSVGFHRLFPADVLRRTPYVPAAITRKERPVPDPRKILKERIVPTIGALRTEITSVPLNYKEEENDILFSFPEQDLTFMPLEADRKVPPPRRTVNSPPRKPSTHIAFRPVDFKSDEESLNVAKAAFLKKKYRTPQDPTPLFLILINELQRSCSLLGPTVCIPQPDIPLAIGDQGWDSMELDSTRIAEIYGLAALASVTCPEDFVTRQPPVRSNSLPVMPPPA